MLATSVVHTQRAAILRDVKTIQVLPTVVRKPEKILAVGFGTGRSRVEGRLVFEDADGKELARVPIKVRGKLLFSGYQSGSTQRQQATSGFEQKLIEELARLK